MNIFILDQDPVVAATYLNNRHTIKMVLESAQLLCTTLNLLSIQTPYKTTHKNHPCAIWVRQNQSNFLWLYNHSLSIANEYTVRYGKIHKCEGVIKSLYNHVSKLPNGELTDFALCMPDQYKTNNPVESYRNYYIGAKRDLAQWKTNIPYWWK
jgi:hypothetical protein